MPRDHTMHTKIYAHSRRLCCFWFYASVVFVLWFLTRLGRPRVACATTQIHDIHIYYRTVDMCERRWVRCSVRYRCPVCCSLHIGTVLVRCADQMRRLGPRLAYRATKDVAYCCGRGRHAFSCVRVVSFACFPEMF